MVARFGPDQGEPGGPVGPLGRDHDDAGSPGTFASTPGRARPDDRTYLYFGGDPTGTIAVAQVPLYGG